jgi:RHS repeat-associated protein
VEQYRPPATTTLTTNASRTQYTHQVTGHVEQVTRAGEVFDYSYDYGRLETVTLPVPSGGGSRPTVTYAYDDGAGGTGVLTRVTHSVNGAVEYGYDRATRGTLPLSETWRVTESGTETTRAVSWAYNARGEVGSVTVEGGPALWMAYDADGLVTGVDARVAAMSGTTSVGALAITRDALAGVELGTTLTAGSGTVMTTQRYNEYAEVVTRGSSYGAASGTGLSFAYEYDGLGRLRHVTESGEGAGEERWYTYDSAGRLARVCATETCLDAMSATTEREAYAYDTNGHRTTWTNDDGTGTSTSVDAQDRLLAYTTSAGAVTCTYDDAGRLHTRTVGSVVDTLAWDAFGGLTSWTRASGGTTTASVTYRNDAMGRRIARVVDGTVTARWVYSGIHPVGEYDASWGLKRVFVYATRGHVPDVVLANESGTWVAYRVVTDHLGSVRRVVRVSDGEVVQRMRYDSYGRVLQDEAASGWERVPFGYAGGLYDRTTGLVRFGAREYDAETGRWLSKDPIGFSGGDGNLYAYVAGVPINVIDPSGLEGSVVDVLAFVWQLPTIAVGGAVIFASNAITDVDPEVVSRHDGIMHVGNVAALGRNGHIAFGPLILHGTPGVPDDYYFKHEEAHVPQSLLLGPLYLPLNVMAQLYSLRSSSELSGVLRSDVLHEVNPIEWGPMNGRFGGSSVPWMSHPPWAEDLGFWKNLGTYWLNPQIGLRHCVR